MFVPMQWDARIDANSILAFFCIALLHLIGKKIAKNVIFTFRKQMQYKVQLHYCEPALKRLHVDSLYSSIS